MMAAGSKIIRDGHVVKVRIGLRISKVKEGPSS
jgi:hypothetical protein